MILDKLFQAMADRQASDIFICAGAPIHIKIQGNRPDQSADDGFGDDREDRRRTVESEQTAAFEKTKEMNLSFGVANSATSASTCSASAPRSRSSSVTSWATSRRSSR
jgi:twitching motility protein PilU